jgi:hypothetical protein
MYGSATASGDAMPARIAATAQTGRDADMSIFLPPLTLIQRVLLSGARAKEWSSWRYAVVGRRAASRVVLGLLAPATRGL